MAAKPSGSKPATKQTASAKKSSAGRGRRPAAEQERKDRIIQTRVPKDLESTLKEAAEQKRMTVSHLIRNVLEDTFNLVDGIVANSSALVEHVTRDAQRIAASARGDNQPAALTPAQQGGALAGQLLEQVDAWQDVIVNKPSQCIECGADLKRGDRAFRGLTNVAEMPAVWLCQGCINNL